MSSMTRIAMGILAAAIGMQSFGYAAGEPSRLYAGTAKADITPAEEDAVNLLNRRRTVREEPIYARVLVLKNDETLSVSTLARQVGGTGPTKFAESAGEKCSNPRGLQETSGRNQFYGGAGK